MGGRWRLGAKALSGSGSVADGGLTQRAARWSVRTGQSGRAGAQARAQSAGGREKLRGPGGEWAVGERSRHPQPRAPGHGAGRGEHGGSLGLAPEGPELDGSCGHHQPGGEVRRNHRGAGSSRGNSEGDGVRQQEKGVKEAGELGMGEGASATHPGRGGQPQCDCGQQGYCRQGERGQRGLLPPQPLAQERL